MTKKPNRPPVVNLRSLFSHPEDCERIQRMAAGMGYDISLVEAAWLWEDYSSWMYAGWLKLPEMGLAEIIGKWCDSKHWDGIERSHAEA